MVEHSEMAASALPSPRSRTAGARRSVGSRVLGGVAWALIGVGLLVALYLVYSLFFTSLGTDAAQARLLDDWQTRVGALDTRPDPVPGSSERERATGTPEPPGATAGAPVPTASPSRAPDDAVPADDPVVGEAQPDAPGGEAVALIWFERPGGSPPVTDEPYVVVSGVSAADLAKGPGHYTQTAGPGEDGNFAVAGHRTTYGAPFFHLEELRAGDRIHVMDTDGEEHVYRFAEQRIVAPTDLSVLAPHPLGDVDATITLTTCHPRFSDRQRMIVFGELVT